MSDPLTTGSDRLRNRIDHYAAGLSEAEAERVGNCIKADPGIITLVETMERFRDGKYLRNEFQDHCIAALKKWETGQ